MVYMVYLTIYLLGNRIGLFMTGFDIISGWMYRVTHVIEFYRIMMLGGIAMAAYLFFCARKSLIAFDTIVLGAYLIVLMFSAVANRDLGFSQNFLESAKIGMVIVDFYLLARVCKRGDWDYIVKRVVFWACYIWDIGCLVSMGMYLFNYKSYCFFSGFNRPSRQGIMSGRLFGVFNDPNYAAFIAFLILGGILYSYRRFGEKWVRIFLIASAVINVCYIVLSISRSTYVTILCTLVLAVFYSARGKGDKFLSPATAKYLCSRIFVGLALAVAVYFVVLFTFQGVGYLVAPDRSVETEFERDDVSGENISNSRFRIWMDYLELWKNRPVTGFSARGALTYAKRLDPESYLSDRQYNTHNMYLLVLVQTGILGAAAMLLFFGRLYFKVIKVVFSKRKLSRFFALSLFWTVTGFVFNFFNVGVFTSYRFETMLFWCALGYLGEYINGLERKKSIGRRAGV